MGVAGGVGVVWGLGGDDVGGATGVSAIIRGVLGGGVVAASGVV